MFQRYFLVDRTHLAGVGRGGRSNSECNESWLYSCSIVLSNIFLYILGCFFPLCLHATEGYVIRKKRQRLWAPIVIDDVNVFTDGKASIVGNISSQCSV